MCDCVIRPVTLILFCLKMQNAPDNSCKKIKTAHTRLPSVGYRSRSRFLAVSLQVTWVINPALGCHHFPPVTLATLKRLYQFRCLVNRGTMGVNSLPKTVTRQRRDCWSRATFYRNNFFFTENESLPRIIKATYLLPSGTLSQTPELRKFLLWHIDHWACCWLSSRKVDAQSVINWTAVGQLSWQYLRAPTLDRCSLSQWSSTARSCHAVQLARAGTCCKIRQRTAACRWLTRQCCVSTDTWRGRLDLCTHTCS